jgi:hypothetical protein
VVAGETAVATESTSLPTSVVPGTAPPGPVIVERVLAVIAEVEAQTGPRLELALIRAQLAVGGEGAIDDNLAHELAAAFPDALASRVAAARLALAKGDAGDVRKALDLLAGERGSLAWALQGRWQCASCGNRPGSFSWRCGQCRRWGALRMETGIEPPPSAPRDRRAAPRGKETEEDNGRMRGLLGATPAEGLPVPTLEPGLTADELARAGTRRSLLGRVGGWFSGVRRRDA